jgi:hypothetical protein
MADHAEPAVVVALSKLAPMVPGFAGAVLSLAFIKDATPWQRFVSVAVGLVFAIVVGPALSVIVDQFVWPGVMPVQVDNAIKFLTGLCALGATPPFMDFLKRFAGDPLSVIRPRVGGEG